MTRIFTKPFSVKLPQQNRTSKHEEYGRERGGVSLCPSCGNVEYMKRWLPSLKSLRTRVRYTNIKVVREQKCPACSMIASHLFEGELIAKGFPKSKHAELINLMTNFGTRATKLDPQDRIIAIEKMRQGIRITTTENQLANRLAKKIRDSFNTVDVTFTHSQEPFEVGRVHVNFISHS